MYRIVPCALLFAALAAAQSGWTRLSSKSGDLPQAVPGKQQTAAIAADLDKNGAADIVITERTMAPSVVWLRRTAKGWDRYVIDAERLRVEAGGVAHDLDRDGDLDLLFGGDSQSNQVWWWENPGPKFDPATPWKRRLIKDSGGRKHHDQLIADVDKDGRPELVFWNQGGQKLYLARIPGDPKATEPWPLVEIFSWTGREMEGITAADVNADGKLDIVGGGRWFEHVSGDTFREHVIDDTQRFSRAAAGQLKKGGWAEVAFVVGDGVGRLRWYEYADGKWTPHDLLDQDVIHGHSLQIADVDRDGNLDVFCGEMGKWVHPIPRASNVHPRTWLFYGDGKGSFQKQVVQRGYGMHEGRLADLDGDKRLDILSKPYNWDTPRVDVLLNSGSPRRPPRPLPLGNWQRHVIDPEKPWRAIFIDAADLDGDGKRDIVAGGWWYKNPDWKRAMIGEPFFNLACLADFDNDGLIDLLGTQGKASEANPKFVVARNAGLGKFDLITDVPAGQGDFLQGCTAIQATPGPVSIALSWHKAGQGIQLLTAPRKPGAEPWKWQRVTGESQDEDASAADIDRDGDQDLLLGTWWLRNDAGSWTKFVLNPASGDPDRNRLADINHDGRLDAVVGFEAINVPGKMAWYEQPADSTGTWTEHVIAQVVGPMSLDVQDMDGDLDLDVVVGEHNYKEPATATLWVFENVDGAGKEWKKHSVYVGDEHHDGARVVDIDDDGDFDIISLGWSHPRVVLYENKAVTPGAGARR
jgi:hypothetical protein